VGDSLSAKCAAERRDDAFVAEKFWKAHALALLARGCRRENAFDGGENVDGKFLPVRG